MDRKIPDLAWPRAPQAGQRVWVKHPIPLQYLASSTVHVAVCPSRRSSPALSTPYVERFVIIKNAFSSAARSRASSWDPKKESAQRMVPEGRRPAHMVMICWAL